VINIYVFNILCASSWNKMKRLTARMHGVESFGKSLQQRQAMIFVTRTTYVLCEEELNPWHII
jgi:hypothetical protein